MTVQPLQRIDASIFPLLCVVVGIFAVGSSYTFAVLLGQVQPFPYTDITHTAMRSPSKFIFRALMLTLSVIMAWTWNICYQWLANENNKQRANLNLSWIRIAGFTGSVAICISSMCIEADAMTDAVWIMHSVAATSFFILFMFAQAWAMFKISRLRVANPTFVTVTSMLIKKTCVFTSMGLLTLQILAVYKPLQAFFNEFLGDVGHVVEWFATCLLLLYFMSFYFDWKGKMYTTIELIQADQQEMQQVAVEQVVPVQYIQQQFQ